MNTNKKDIIENLKTTSWNPWHGCHKISVGCKNCYMYKLDELRGVNSSNIVTKNISNFNLPLKKNKQGEYKIPDNSMVFVCMTSDFFIEEADSWREEIWKIIKKRNKVIFNILTKRTERIQEHLPIDWGEGYENVILNISVENQEMADKRIPIFLGIKSKMKGLFLAPLLENINISRYLSTGQIFSVRTSGENYEGARLCRYEWVLNLRKQCIENNVNFNWYELGTKFEKNGKIYSLNKTKQSEQIKKANLDFNPNPIIIEQSPIEYKQLNFKELI